MAKFFGRVGYGETVETTPGVWEDSIVEHSYYGDVVRNSRQLQEGENLNKDLSVQNSISIVADEYANDHFFAIRYVEWAGTLWTVSNVEVQSPRLLLRLGRCTMAPRLQLHDILVTLCDNVYFQPPTNVLLKYPCIIYKRDYAETQFADSKPYTHTKRYMVTVIDQDPDSDIPDKVALMPMSLFNRFYTVDNLNHDVYSVFF